MIYDLIIIGGGPAGMTAGIYAARHKLNTLLITKEFGGQMSRKATSIENYPGFETISGFELIQKFEKHLRKQNINIELGEVMKVEKANDIFLLSTENKKQFESKTVIIGSGADPRPLEVPGEKELIGRGISYCVHCDGPLFSGKTVAVVGGGNSGFETAIYLSKISKKVYVFEAGEKVKADQENQIMAEKTGNIEVITYSSIKKILGEKFVSSIIYEDKRAKKEIVLPLEGVFIEIGSQPATSFVKDLVDFNERDEIKADPETFQTKTPGLFAAGDVNVGKYKQIVTACGEGAKAALAAADYLQKFKK